MPPERPGASIARILAVEVLRCPSCGAPVEPKATDCPYCKAALHPLRCPWCFSWTFAETRDCPRCGAAAVPPDPGAAAAVCPACRTGLTARSMGKARLAGCGGCGGIWADATSFQALCEDRSTQAAYLGEGSLLPRPNIGDPSSSPILYRPCPACGELMNRFNFAGCSGVVLDSCKPHGVWFDPDELRRIVEFIRAGGLDMARGKERERLELERRRLELAAQDADPGASAFRSHVPDSIASARGLLDFIIGLKH